MSLLRRLLWLMVALVVLDLAVYVTRSYEVAERLLGAFLALQPWLPVRAAFQDVLVLLPVASLLVLAAALGVCTWLALRHAVRQRQALLRQATVQRAMAHLHEQHRQQCEQLLLFSQSLTKQLDKRLLLQAAMEGVSRLMSVAHASSLVSCWLMHFESDTLRFETGLYCDEAMFERTAFQQTELPFSRVIGTRQPWLLPVWSEGGTFVKREGAAQLGAATALILWPLVIEGDVLGVLCVFCHPDMLKGYDEQAPFYRAVWGQVTLAVATALQGEIALLDRLTGTHNREYFARRLAQEIERANRYQLPMALLMIDIDNFKRVNDTFGHPQGDAVLKIIAKLIKHSVRAIDLVGRYGGEEFIVMLPETGYGEVGASAGGALTVAERIRASVEEEFRGMQQPLGLSVSIGVAVRRFPDDRDATPRDLIRIVDEQLYRAKTSGKNTVCASLPQPAS